LLPIFIGGAVGAFRGRVPQWLGFGVVVSLLVVPLALFDVMAVILLAGVLFTLMGWQRTP
jgi:hypothetical protein